MIHRLASFRRNNSSSLNCYIKKSEQGRNERLKRRDQIALPMQGMMEQYGGTIDIQELTEIFSELMDLPRLKQIVKFEEPKEDRPGPKPQQPAQASHTVRESVRKSVPTGGTEQSRSNVMQQILQGGQPNQQQMAQMGREKAVG